MTDALSCLKINEQAFFLQLTELPFIDTIYAHGSRVKGDAHRFSDLDLAILCPDASEEEWDQIMAIINEAPILIRFDVIRLDKLTDPFSLIELLKHAKILYSRTSDESYEQKKIRFVVSLLNKNLKDLEKLTHVITHEYTDEQKKLKSHTRWFIYVFKNSYRSAKLCLRIYGVSEDLPLPCLRHAYALGWITDREIWEAMAVHFADISNHKEIKTADAVKLARGISLDLTRYVEAMREFNGKLREVIRPYTY